MDIVTQDSLGNTNIQVYESFNSREKTLHSMNGLVLNASENTDTQIGNR